MPQKELFSVCVNEAGWLFQIEELPGVDRWWMCASSPGKDETTWDDVTFDELCTALDGWVAANACEGAARFGGFVAEVFDHETGDIETAAYSTRGATLRVGDLDQPNPSAEEFAAALQWSGDKTMRVWDGAGVLLLDNREALVQAVVDDATHSARRRFGMV